MACAATSASTSALRLLPLAALVAFPGAPPYSLTAAGKVEDGSTVGLIHRPPGTANPDDAPAVGVLATVSQVVQQSSSSSSNNVNVITCVPLSRFRVEEYLPSVFDDDGNEILMANVTPWEDEDKNFVGAPKSLQEECADTLRDFLRLQQVTSYEALPTSVKAVLDDDNDDQDGSSSAAADHVDAEAFSLALAGVLELELAEAQAMLDDSSSADRLRKLQTRLEESKNFAAAQAALRALGM